MPVSCTTQGFLSLSETSSTTSHLNIYILSVLIIWEVPLTNACRFLTSRYIQISFCVNFEGERSLYVFFLM